MERNQIPGGAVSPMHNPDENVSLTYTFDANNYTLPFNSASGGNITYTASADWIASEEQSSSHSEALHLLDLAEEIIRSLLQETPEDEDELSELATTRGLAQLWLHLHETFES